MAKVNRASSAKRQSKSRSTAGQAIVEGTVMLVVLTIFAVLFFFLFLNTTIIGSYNFRLQALASEAARELQANRWWLGMQRPMYNQAVQEADTKHLINAELKMMGLPPADNIEFTYKHKKIRGINVVAVTVDFDVKKLPLSTGGVAPLTMDFHGKGVATDAEYAVPKHGMALIHVVDPSDNKIERAIRVPVYNATIGHQTPASDVHLRMDEAIGENPSAYLRLVCKHTGQLSKEWTPKEGVTRSVPIPSRWDDQP